MNKWVGMGRLTFDPEIRVSGEMKIARCRIAVDRRFKKEGEQSADFIPLVAFGKQADFIEKYITKGIKVLVSGRIQTGSYDDKNGNRIYTTDIIVEEIEFAESKNASSSQPSQQKASNNDRNYDSQFMVIPDGFEDLPFN